MIVQPPSFTEPPQQLTLQSLLQRPSPPVPFPPLRPPPQLAHRPPSVGRPPALTPMLPSGAPVLRDPRTGMQLRFQPPKNWSSGGGGGGGYPRQSRPRAIRPAAAAASSSLFRSASHQHDFLRSQMAGRYMPGPASRVQAHFVHDASGQ
jgi:hypothetical protein